VSGNRPTAAEPKRIARAEGKVETTGEFAMVCSMIKKGVLGAALGAGALYLVFGAVAPSYVRTAFHKVRHHAQDAVPIQFQIDRARDQVASIEPAIHDNIESLARAEVDVEYLEREIDATRTNLAAEKREMTALREGLETSDSRLAGMTATTDEIKGELGRRLDHYKVVSQILKDKESILKSKKAQVVAARKQLTTLAMKKKELLAQIEEIEARLKMIEATKANNEFNFDDSALAQAKQTISELQKRLDVEAHFAALEGRFAETGVPAALAPGRNVVKEFDAEFGAPAKDPASKTVDKSL
jgi:peptidoglycan hydrolase CwlO-like protein